ncbi:MAG TPA: hypothetical protein VJN96_03025 [Vicinamibacterales bacterium]|nr:hypothetical protein [Vicinamibacterales bacterium]
MINDVRFFRVNGDKTTDEDARLVFGGGQIQVRSRKDEALALEPYKRLARATYVRAKNPKWDQSLPGPSPALDFSGFLQRGTRHWLVLQSKTDFVILRLEDSNWQTILDTFETRTGLKVDRPPATDK